MKPAKIPTSATALLTLSISDESDIVLARQTVWREAREQAKTPADHVAHLVVHGVLHLLGYDHETGDADAEHMEALERRILARLGIADPY